MGSVSTVFLENRQGVKFGTAVHNTKGILDYVHTDVWGPSKNESIGGNRWFVTFIDDFSRGVWVYMMKHKDEVLDIFLKWKKMVWRLKLEGELRLFGQIMVVSTLQILSLKFVRMM
jgi:hypothetical protein